MKADDILDALIAVSDEMIWAKELAFFSGMRRIDFFTMNPTESGFFRTSSYEIKVSKADFRRDSATKQEGALRWSDRFWYVAPPGIIDRKELPDWAGLQEFDGERFKVIARAPRLKKAAPSWELVVSLLRNSGDCRRDVGLMKAQLEFYRSQDNHDRKIKDLSRSIRFQHWLDRQHHAETGRPSIVRQEAAE